MWAILIKEFRQLRRDRRTVAAGTLAGIVGDDTLEDALVRLMKENRS